MAFEWCNKKLTLTHSKGQRQGQTNFEGKQGQIGQILLLQIHRK